MKNWSKLNLLILVLISSLLSSCASKVPFTNTIRDKYNLTADQIKQLQFYLSKDVTIERIENNTEDKGTTGGKLVLSTDKSVDELYFPKGTMGVAIEVYDDGKVAVSFDEDGDNTKYLMFGENAGRYTLLAKDWKSGQGKLNYGGKTYEAKYGAAGSYILFELKRVKNFKKNAKKVKGRKI